MHPLTEDFSDARVGERLAALVAEEQDGSLTALEVAGLMHVSITLAQEFLKVRPCTDPAGVWGVSGRLSSMSVPLPHSTPMDRSALHILQTAEEGGHLCRDESIHGLLFYPNRFPEFAGTLGKGKDVGP